MTDEKRQGLAKRFCLHLWESVDGVHVCSEPPDHDFFPATEPSHYHRSTDGYMDDPEEG
jgi:hypothetical protein